MSALSRIRRFVKPSGHTVRTARTFRPQAEGLPKLISPSSILSGANYTPWANYNYTPWANYNYTPPARM